MNSTILNYLLQNIELFSFFEGVYVFGSILTPKKHPNDIDLLLTYNVYNDSILIETKNICSIIERELLLPVDLTVLSLEELNSTDFLKNTSCFKKIK
jgi:predicted nucleotidyltransferase